MPNPGFTLAEDAALKLRLSNLSVHDDRNQERIPGVFFRFPQAETETIYPFITIELIDIIYARQRQESERQYVYSTVAGKPANLYHYPSELAEADLLTMAGDDAYLTTDQFVPVDLLYQVTTHCRSQRHDRQLTMLMFRRVFPLRRGWITIPEDGTIRRCDLTDWRPIDLLDQETGYKKRIFRKAYTVTINAEIPQSDLLGASKVLSVHGELHDHNSSDPTDLLEEF